MNLKSMLMLLLKKNKFHAMELVHVEHLHKKYNEAPPSKEFHEQALSRINDKRKVLLSSFIWVLFIVSTGCLIAYYINLSSPLSWLTIRIIRGISMVLIAWSVLSRLQDIQTMKGETLIELTSAYLYKWFYSLGIFLASCSLFLEGAAVA